MSWDFWVDYHRTDERGLTHTNLRNAKPGIVPEPGAHIVVGNEEAEPAVAKVAAVEPDGTVLVRVLPGPAEQHLHLVTGRRTG